MKPKYAFLTCAFLTKERSLDIRRLASIYIDIPAMRPGTVGAYALAVLSALAATVVRLAVDPYVVGTQYLVFHSAVMITTLSSGLAAGLLCALLSFASVVLFIRPLDYVGLSLFIVVLLLDVLVPAAMRFAVEGYRELSRTLEWRVEDRTAEVVQRSRELDEKNRQLRQASDELLAVYDQGLFASHLNMEGRIVHANRACVEDLGFAREEIIGKLFWEAGWWCLPEAEEWIRKAFERAAAGTPSRGELRYVLKDGAERVADIAFIPIKDEAGHVTSVFVPGTDITDRARQYRATFENAGVGIGHLSPDGKWLRVNRTFAGIVGYSPGELASKTMQDITHPDDLDFSFAQLERLGSGKADSYEMEKRYVRKDGTTIWVQITGTVMRRNDGSVDHFLSVIQDITERKQHEEREHLLMREINHRSKNMLSVVDAIAHQTATGNPEDFIERFSERIQALSANQDLLVRNEWKGVDVEDLVRAQLAHFADLIGTRIAIRGPKLRLNPACAQAIGLALHELGTNAGKYGALSTDGGRVDVCWNLSDNTFTASWTEREGPSVSAPPRRGFGTTVVKQMTERSLGGAVDLDFAPSGLTWCLTCPAGNALERSEPRSSFEGKEKSN